MPGKSTMEPQFPSRHPREIVILPLGVAEDYEYTWLVSLCLSEGKRRDGIKTSDGMPARMYGWGWLQHWVEKDSEALCWERDRR